MRENGYLLTTGKVNGRTARARRRLTFTNNMLSERIEVVSGRNDTTETTERGEEAHSRQHSNARHLK